MTKALGLIALTSTLVLPVLARAQGTGPNAEVQLLTVLGQVVADEKTAEKVGFDDLSIGFSTGPENKLVWLAVVKAEGWDGDGFRGKALLDRVDGYTPNLTAAGKPDLVGKLQQMPVGSRVSIDGIVDLGPRTYLLGSVRVLPSGDSK